MRSVLLATCLSLVPAGAGAQVTYHETQDDFSNGIVRSVVMTSEGEKVHLGVSCLPGGALQIHLVSSTTIFPEEGGPDNGMLASVTHKFDTAPAAETAHWWMNMMRYKDAWYRGDISKFVREALAAKTLALRLNRTGDVFRFKLDGLPPLLVRVVRACTGG